MIEGEIVNLRAPERDDLDRLWTWINDPEVIEHLSMRYPMSREAERAWLEMQTAGPLRFFDVRFAIETKDGAQIGSIAFHRVVAEQRSATLGIMIGDKAHWSRGYGADAIRTLLRFAFDQMNLRRVDLSVDADNARGIACYRKCGFIEEVRQRAFCFRRGTWIDGLEMGVLRPEFEVLHGVTPKEEQHA